MLRLVAGGSELVGFDRPEPAASIRVLVPSGEELVLPAWNGNEFLMADGTRPLLRTFTPLDVDPDKGTIEFWVVRHEGGAVSTWAESARPGDPLAISGPGSGFVLPEDVGRLLVFADETALPAVSQLIGLDVSTEAHIEVVDESAVLDLGESIEWHLTPPGRTPGHRLAELATGLDSIEDGTHVWVAGEASAVQAIRKHLFQTLGASRSRATVRGYWKPSRS